MNKQVIVENYSRAAAATDRNLCCAVDYRMEFPADELSHVPAEVLDRNYGCGVPAGLRSLQAGQTVLDLGPGLGRDCFIAARRVGPEGHVYGLDMNPDMLEQARRHKQTVVRRLGYDNMRFLEGQFDVEIPLQSESIDVIFSNCVNNLAVDKTTAYLEMFRVLRRGSKLSFSDIVSCHPLPEVLRNHDQAWADCVAGVLSFRQLHEVLSQTGFQGITLTTDYLWKTGPQTLREYFGSGRSLSPTERAGLESVRLYSVLIEAFKPLLDPDDPCYWKGHHALYHGPGVFFQFDNHPDHVFRAGELKEVCEKTATLLKKPPFSAHFTVFEPEGEVEPRLCLPGGACC